MSHALFARLGPVLAPIVRDFGLPPLDRVESVEDRLTVLRGRVMLVDGQCFEVVVGRPGLCRRPIAHLRAAHFEQRRCGWPVPAVFRSVWVPPLNDVVVFRGLPAGERASELVAHGRMEPAVAFRALGRLLGRRLPAAHPAGWASRGFLRARRFADVLTRSARDAERLFRVAGVDPGPAWSEVLDHFEGALRHVEERDPVLTHGGLGLPNLRMDEGHIVEIEGWTQSMLGDWAYDFGVLLHFGPEAVEVALDAAERPHPGEARLAVGFFGKLVVDGGTWASLIAGAPEPLRSAYAVRMRGALERALLVAPAGWSCAPPPPTPAAPWFRMVDRLRGYPPCDRSDMERIAGAVAAMEVEGWDPRRREEEAHRRLDGVGAYRVAPGDEGEAEGEPIAHPVAARVFGALEQAFGGVLPAGVRDAVARWDRSFEEEEPQDAFASIRHRCLRAWAGDERGVSFANDWEMVAWRIERGIGWDEALERAARSADPLDLCRLLGARRIGDVPREELYAVLFPDGEGAPDDIS